MFEKHWTIDIMFQHFRLVGLALLLSVCVGGVGKAEAQFQFGTEVTMDEKIERILSAARSNCSSKAGQFEFKDQTTQIPIHAPITSIEIDHDAQIELIKLVDESGFHCSASDEHNYCDGYGCKLHLVSNSDYISLTMLGWEIIQNSYGDLVLLAQLDGKLCGEPSLVPCFKSIYFYGRYFVSQ